MKFYFSTVVSVTFLNSHGSSAFSVDHTSRTSSSLHATSPNSSNPTTNVDDYVNLNRRDAISNALKTAALVTGANSLYPSVSAAAEETPLTSVPMIQLGNSSLNVSRTIQGYWQLAGGHGKYKPDDAISNMEAHYKAGITTLDTADIYGASEALVGRYMKTNPDAIPLTKFCCFKFLDEIDKAEVRARITKACERLQVPSLPLVQFFWSNYDIKRYVDVGLMLAELKEEGLIQNIGATNFDLKRLRELKEGGVPIVSNQVQLSCLDSRPIQSGMADWCAENDVSLIGFGTVGSGILSERYLGRATGPTQEEKNTASMRMYSKTAERFGSWKLVQELLNTMDAVASDVRSSGRCPEANISNIAQRYVLDTKSVASVLIGVRNQNHIAENIRSHSFQLNSDERDAINAVIAKRKGPAGDVWDIERGTVV
uniref:NADP-dependent oxidoreductase domain-containing protein n=1 Tax=Chaetoceros debilis TaxID=122233 RepID=A0A7S3VHA1_9STRA|mmetsp:Transcript_6616/g.9685  ORF Transcript_6616/g.9685 Transcript_6616/m.9685 type:complete len:427 (+) Transcript_6616:143-1423(+)|eukprot:CAMPEP_0194089442 /NCGR_PEP_ID=MMETSP0149-20130528/34312_1 /TAXON_ID=122233 /ORGANISM="Chaetoceros debilis, Strain MM31A-1" /LENGTH=426 /DNA_ID=CAMNT_0038773365 /DNA_START=33 /DNA_END=1313 /DNA_ORIENTATION=-